MEILHFYSGIVIHRDPNDPIPNYSAGKLTLEMPQSINSGRTPTRPHEIQPAYPGTAQPIYAGVTQPAEPPQSTYSGEMQPAHPGPTQPISPEVTQPAKPPQSGYPNGMQAPASPGSQSQQLEQSIFNLVNTERTNHGLVPLNPNEALSAVARRKSMNMGDLGYFSHNAPDGTTTMDWLIRDGYSFNAWGENIADFGPNPTAMEIMNGWMNSPGHRANILANNFTLLGVGIYQVNGRTFATQVFGHLD